MRWLVTPRPNWVQRVGGVTLARVAHARRADCTPTNATTASSAPMMIARARSVWNALNSLRPPIEATEATDAIEPTEPTDRIEPAEPIERIEPAEPIERMEPVEPSDFIDPVEPAEAQLVAAVVALVAFANRTAPRPLPRETPITPRPARSARPTRRRTAPRPDRCSRRPVVCVRLN